MQAHALTVAMENALNPDRHKEEVAYPFLTLLVSGKHVGSSTSQAHPRAVLTYGMPSAAIVQDKYRALCHDVLTLRYTCVS